VKLQRELITNGGYADTYYYYDHNGLKAAEVDALGYLTTYKYDETGDLTEQMRYATASASWNTTTFTLPATSSADRQSVYVYDKLNRLASETLYVDTGTGVRQAATTSYNYNALGNSTAITAAGATTYHYYDALGRLIDTAEPARDVDGSSAIVMLTPLTQFFYDARGNMVRQVQYANGAASATGSGYSPGPASTVANNPDRITLAAYDIRDLVVRTLDATGAYSYASYTARGDLAKQWQPTTNNEGVTETLVTRYGYDALGRRTQIEQPQTLGGAAGQAIVTRTVSYNAFGEVTQQSLNNAVVEVNKYDQAGRLWFSNSGDGVGRIYQYNVGGQATVVVRSQTQDLSAVTNSSTGGPNLAGITQQVRSETLYDKLGRVIEQRDAIFDSSAQISQMDNSFQLMEANGALYVSWSNVPAGMVQVFQYRVAGSSNWTPGVIQTLVSGPTTRYGVNVSGFTSGQPYEYRVTLTRPGDTTA
jgi:YD repeat-containing protein